MAFRLRPTFVTLTWRSAFTDELLWLRIGAHVQREFGLDCLMHLTCHLPVTALKRVLNRCREAGIRNILALRGDPPIGQDAWVPCEGGLANAVELVELIRAEHGDYFCVAVAAYPETHTECWNSPDLPPSEQCRDLDMERLKTKVDAGADFVITQFFYDVDAFIEFKAKYEAAGIDAVLLPGYMPIQNYRGFAKFTKWCKTAVPAALGAAVEEVKDNDEAVKALGVQEAASACKRLLAASCRSLHFYTMNLSASISSVLAQLDLVPKSHEREAPWDTGAPVRDKEEVRPIFWSNRAASYLARTAEWDEFPNGRWGDFRSPAYGELTDYYLAFKRPKVNRVTIWGQPKSEEDVRETFVGFVDGHVPQLPWCDTPLAIEAGAIVDNLRWMNRHGFLTINSQPRVNGAPSDDPKVGWGGDDGIVFQKAYLEFFVSPAVWSKLLAAFERYPSLTYHAMDVSGTEYINTDRQRATAVTWGVFPGREILQPTVVDPESFRAWKDEAFELWRSQWGSSYTGEDKNSVRAREVIEEIRTTWLLVNVVDNDYVEPESDIFSIFKQVATEMMSEEELRGAVLSAEAENRALRARADALDAMLARTAADLAFQSDRAARAEKDATALRRRVHELEARTVLSSAGIMAKPRAAALAAPEFKSATQTADQKQ
jgi:methylenetetrahydrofolate reductase (NADPH)